MSNLDSYVENIQYNREKDAADTPEKRIEFCRKYLEKHSYKIESPAEYSERITKELSSSTRKLNSDQVRRYTSQFTIDDSFKETLSKKDLAEYKEVVEKNAIQDIARSIYNEKTYIVDYKVDLVNAATLGRIDIEIIVPEIKKNLPKFSLNEAIQKSKDDSTMVESRFLKLLDLITKYNKTDYISFGNDTVPFNVTFEHIQEAGSIKNIIRNHIDSDVRRERLRILNSIIAKGIYING